MCSDIQVNWITFFGSFDNWLASNEIIYWYNLLNEEKQLLKRNHKISAISDFCWHLLFWLLSCVKHSRKCVFQKNQNTTQNAKNEIWFKLVYQNTFSISKTKCALKGITGPQCYWYNSDSNNSSIFWWQKVIFDLNLVQLKDSFEPCNNITSW